MMNRRAVVTGLVAIGGLPIPTQAQVASPAGKIGYLHSATISPGHLTRTILEKAWRDLGYVEGQTVLLRSGERDPQRLPRLVEELIGLGTGVLIVVGADAVLAAARVTRTHPIVAIDLETDSVRSGLVERYARPGGNVTGLFLDQPALADKWIELLREAVPGLERVALLWDPSAGSTQQLEIAKEVAGRFNLEVVVVEVPITSDFERLLGQLAGGWRTGLILLTTPGSGLAVSASIAHGLPMVSFLRGHARAGVLMTYGPNQEDYFPRAVALADKILRGDKPGDIPIERPARIEFVVNLKTAKALALTIPATLLARADEVIE